MKLPALERPETHDKRPGMGTPAEMWKYRLAQRVKGLRLMQDKGQGWSQTFLASVCRIDKHTVQRIEHGLGCNPDTLVRIAQTLGVSTDFLLGLDRVPTMAHEVVDRAYERVCSVASSLDFTIKNPGEVSMNHLSDTLDMLNRARQGLVDLAFRLRHPDPNNFKLRAPYGYEYVEKMEAKLGHELD